MPPLTARLPTTPGNSAAHRPQVAGLSPTKRRHLSAHSGSLSSSDRAQLAGLNRTAAHSSEDGERQSASVPGTHSRPVLLFSPSSPPHPPIRALLSVLFHPCEAFRFIHSTPILLLRSPYSVVSTQILHDSHHCDSCASQYRRLYTTSTRSSSPAEKRRLRIHLLRREVSSSIDYSLHYRPPLLNREFSSAPCHPFDP